MDSRAERGNLMECPNCKVPMRKKKSKFGNNYWYGCPNFPSCKVTCADHPDGTTLSYPADEETKQLRMKAHQVAEHIWGKWDSPKCKKREMYNWMERNTIAGHIGKMEKEELLLTIRKLETTLKWKGVK